MHSEEWVKMYWLASIETWRGPAGLQVLSLEFCLVLPRLAKGRCDNKDWPE